MDKKYNGFNNGRDTTDGVGGREVNHGTPETMTKEQILEKHAGGERMTFVYSSEALFAMEEYAQQQLSAERERAGKLVEALEQLKDNMPEWNPSAQKYDSQIIAQQTLNEYDTATKES